MDHHHRQQPSWLSSQLSSSEQPQQQVIRSSPIAIARSPSSDDDSDNDDGNDVLTQMSHLTVGSLPSRLARSMPGAPHLTSRQARSNRHLPPIALSEQATNDEIASSSVPVSYGSLRESHLQGRFMDGPASYRDSTSGRIHKLDQQRRMVVRFDDSSTSYKRSPMETNHNSTKYNDVPNKKLISGDRVQSDKDDDDDKPTPGERMQEARKQRGLLDSSSSSLSSGMSPKETTTSSSGTLAAMMQDAPKEEEKIVVAPQQLPLHDQSFGQELHGSSSMLSTSLTALEVLRNAAHDPLPQPPPPAANVLPSNAAAAAANQQGAINDETQQSYYHPPNTDWNDAAAARLPEEQQQQQHDWTQETAQQQPWDQPHAVADDHRPPSPEHNLDTEGAFEFDDF